MVFLTQNIECKQLTVFNPLKVELKYALVN